MQQMFFIEDLIACSTCFGHHYAHYQELESWLPPVVFGTWFSSWKKICNKKHLLHLVGILFPHINDDTRSKSLQTIKYVGCKNINAVQFSTHKFQINDYHIVVIRKLQKNFETNDFQTTKKWQKVRKLTLAYRSLIKIF
jgi:hypothetical protein